MRSLDQLPAYNGHDLNVIIETPKGSQNKFAYEPDLGMFVLKGVLPAGAVFPFDFGFVPSTAGEDGDPLDVLVLMDAPAFVGCLVHTRLIGAIEADQTEGTTTERNDRLIAVASKSITHRSLQELHDVNLDLVGQIEHFFRSYNDAKGKTFKPIGRADSRHAGALVRRGIELHQTARR